MKVLVLGVACMTMLIGLPAVAADMSFTDENLEISADSYRIKDIDGVQTLTLENGQAVLKSFVFENGVIEFDVKFPEQRGFVGVRFRRQDNANYEDFYIRSHQSGNPDANQYSPTFNGVAAWQILYGPQYATPVTYNHDEWTHVKIVVSGDKADFYAGSEEPILHVDDLLRDQAAGGIALWTNITTAHFANLKIERKSGIELVGSAVAHPPLRAGVISKWSVSEAFSSEETEGSLVLDDALQNRLEWGAVDIEVNGVANLARVARGARDKNVVLAKAVIEADNAVVKRMEFGFSDKAKVYLNGDLLYAGDDVYGLRDYRFLGTVGFYDALYLPLKKGRNEIVFAVTETFGGWAVAGAIADRASIEIVGE